MSTRVAQGAFPHTSTGRSRRAVMFRTKRARLSAKRKLQVSRASGASNLSMAFTAPRQP